MTTESPTQHRARTLADWQELAEDKSALVLCDPESAESVPVNLRCQRTGCKGRWPSAQDK